MTYVTLSLVFVAIAAAVLAVALATAPNRRDLVARWWLPAAVTAIALLVLTAVFDNVMIATGLMVYEPEHLAGILIGAAPIEDFAYPAAGLLLLPAVWLLSGRRSGGRRFGGRRSGDRRSGDRRSRRGAGVDE